MTEARDGSSVVVTSEPEENGTASLVASRVGVPTLELDDEARERWAAIAERSVRSVPLRGPEASAPRLLAARSPAVRSLLAPGSSAGPSLGVPHTDRPRRKP